jgi:PHD/YefM family antitoxin component YafN of YafNO toxin-antitoxin module
MKVTALQIRNSLGKILKKLENSDEPIIVEKDRKPVAVLISLKTFKDRFIDYREQKKREEMLNRFIQAGVKSSQSSLEVLRELRYGSSSDH